MANQDPLGRSLYFHHASAYGIAGQIDRPIQQTIPTQAAVSLAPSGGHGSHRIENFESPGFVSFGAAYTHVGGSYDEDHETHATYASAVVEDLNICDIITADRIVSRLNIYSDVTPDDLKKPTPLPSFSIVGSHFKNLRIAGHKIDIELTDHPFNNDTYDNLHGGGKGSNKAHKHRKWIIGSHAADQLGKLKDNGVKNQLEHNHRVVSSLGERFQQWEKRPPDANTSYRCSAVDHDKLEEKIAGSDLTNFGGIICVPRFGLIYLAELAIYRNHRHLTMIRVHMCSTASGGIDGGGTTGGGGSMPPP